MRRLVIAFGLLIALCIVTVGCYNPRLKAEIFSGHQLLLGLGTAQETDHIIFRQNGKRRILRPSDGKTLVAIPLTIQNNQAGKALLLVDENAALLRDSKYRNFPPIDPFSQAVPLEDSSIEGEGKFLPFLWGKYELERDFRITGWLIFETPPDRTWQAIEWEQGDTIVAYFP